MGNFLRDVRDYLAEWGHEEIYLDFMPDLPDECLALFLTAETPCRTGDGSTDRVLSVRARGRTPGAAALRASAALEALDSGEDERLIRLAEGRTAIARPRSGPCKLKEDDFGRVIYGFECALWSPH